MRKFLIGLISFVVVCVVFWIYVGLMDTPPIQGPDVGDTPDLEVPQMEAGARSIGDTKPIEVRRPRFFKYDPITKEIVAEYGFDVLLNPGEGSSRWRVEKPYLIFYQEGGQYRIDAKRGIFQIDTVASQSTPNFKDVQLDEDVVIHIAPSPESKMAETTILMDDLMFSSERSEFATDGPVTIQSSQVQMEGYGLTLIFNTGIGKIEYLQIKDLDILRLRGFASSDTDSGLDGNSNKRDNESETKPGLTEGDESKQYVAGAQPNVLPQEETKVDISDLYQCAIADNVLIRYGDKLLVSGADQVNIQNILLSSMNETDSEGAAEERQVQKDTKVAATTSVQKTESDSMPSTTGSVQSVTQLDDDSHDIVVRCDGGMIIQPMKDTGDVQSDSDLAFEMLGTPLKIDHVDGVGSDGSDAMAHCGALSYKPTEDILRLFTSALQPEILLNTQESNSRIETSGNVFWDRKAQRANIAGPGKVYIGDAKNPTGQPSEIAFEGVMDLLFARMPNNISSATIQTINLTGGMDAVLRQNGTLKTLADSAVLEFGHDNQLSEARLSGDVHFESFEKGESSSQAASESATFYFDNNQIAKADLNGAVHFASASGQMDSANAKIEFETDASGQMHPTAIRTDGKAVLQTVSSVSKQPPAKFEAKRIDYDLQTGSGLAHGPVRFTYFQEADPNENALETWIPLTITADGNAEFIADSNRDIQQIVFDDNVIAMRLFETTLFTQRDEFHGDKLVIDINKDDMGETNVSKITFTEGKVFGQSIKMRGEEKLFHVHMACKEMSFLNQLKDILVTGSGEIQLDNSKAQSTSSGGTGINFRRPCYAFIDGFDTIRWDLNAQKIVADGDEDTMRFVYVPLVDGKEEQYIYVHSQQLEASFLTDSNKTPVLKRVFTDKGVNCTVKGLDKKTRHELDGQTLEYNAISDVGWATITGSEANPCFVDGIRTPAFRFNVNTWEIDTSLSTTPGVLSPLK